MNGRGGDRRNVDSLSQRIEITENYVENVGVAPYTGVGRLFMMLTGTEGLLIAQNTLLAAPSSTLTAAIVFGSRNQASASRLTLRAQRALAMGATDWSDAVDRRRCSTASLALASLATSWCGPPVAGAAPRGLQLGRLGGGDSRGRAWRAEPSSVRPPVSWCRADKPFTACSHAREASPLVIAADGRSAHSCAGSVSQSRGRSIISRSASGDPSSNVGA